MEKRVPIKLLPACKDYLWGGNKLREQFGVKTDMYPLAEAWVVSAHPNGESVVADGVYKGCRFSEYLAQTADGGDGFPVLIKLIDAKQSLSVQVHPDDAYAWQHEGENGKTEMWYVLSADEGASLYYGFCKEVTAQEVRERIASGTLEEVLNAVPVKAGDVFFLPPGTVHAIGAGMVICEIQQNSNTTYRLYDYHRRDSDGNLRELHVDKGLAVARLTPSPVMGGTGDLLADCPYFRVRRLCVQGEVTIPVFDTSFHALVAVEGQGVLSMCEEKIPLSQGDSVFVPAQDGAYTLCGDMTVILTELPH